jgi:acyl-CoA thioester hydrolase
VTATDDGIAGSTLAEITVTRQVEWMDTDAAGHHHHSAVIRWVEAAEAELLGRFGLADLFGRIPRVHYEVDYRSRLWFGEQISVQLRVEHVGRSSMRYGFRVTAERGAVAAEGNVVIVYAEPSSPSSGGWPDDVRAALTSQTT